MIGGELESQKHLGAADSYWEKRVFGVSAWGVHVCVCVRVLHTSTAPPPPTHTQEEIMTASASYHPVLSRLTLALLHDSG